MNFTQIIQYTINHPFILVSLALIILLGYTIHLHRRLSIFMRGGDAKSLETTIATYLDHIDNLRKHDAMLVEHTHKLDKRISQAVRNVSTMRFKAFDQNGGNQSFAIALVNELGDGVIISSLHHPNRVSVFAKPVSGYASTHDLTEEETSVLAEAKTAHKH